MQNINNQEFIKILINSLKNIDEKIKFIEEIENNIEYSFINKNDYFVFNDFNFKINFETIEEQNLINPEIFSYLDELKLSITNKRYDTGSYYTNKYLVNSIINEYDFLNKKTIDPAAGTGNFLINLLLKLKENFKNKNDFIQYISNFIFFNDIDKSSSLVYIKRLNLLSVDFFNEKLNQNDIIAISNNIFNLDFLLNFNPNLKFDCIIGNPPYLGTKSLGKDYLKKIKSEFNFTEKLKRKHLDLSMVMNFF